MSCDHPKRARHRLRQAAYEARLATATKAERFLIMSDGTNGPPLELRGLFEQFLDEGS